MGFVDKIFRKRGSETEVNSGAKVEATTTNKPADSRNANNDATRYVESPTRINWSSLYKKEDWWAVWIGLTIFALSLPSYAGFYTLGWVPVAKPWLYISHALTTKLFNPLCLPVSDLELCREQQEQYQHQYLQQSLEEQERHHRQQQEQSLWASPAAIQDQRQDVLPYPTDRIFQSQPVSTSEMTKQQL